MSSLLIANCTFHSACLHKWSCIYSFYRQTATTGNTNKLPSFTVIFLDLVEICNFFGGCRIWIVIIIINLLLSYYCIEKGHKWASEEVLRTGYMLYSSIALVIADRQPVRTVILLPLISREMPDAPVIMITSIFAVPSAPLATLLLYNIYHVIYNSICYIIVL